MKHCVEAPVFDIDWFTLVQLCQLVAACGCCAATSGEVLRWAISEIVDCIRVELKQAHIKGASSKDAKAASNSVVTGNSSVLMVALVSKVGQLSNMA